MCDTWADAIRFPPWIADERDGTLFNEAFRQARNKSGRRLPDADGFKAPGFLSHSTANSLGGQ